MSNCFFASIVFDRFHRTIFWVATISLSICLSITSTLPGYCGEGRFLLAIPKPGVVKQTIDQALQAAGVTCTRRIEMTDIPQAQLTTLVLFCSGCTNQKYDEALQKLRDNGSFSAVQKDYGGVESQRSPKSVSASTTASSSSSSSSSASASTTATADAQPTDTGAPGTTTHVRAPNDPFYPSQWHLSAVKAPQAWNRAKAKGETIAMLDSGCSSIPEIGSNKLYVPPNPLMGGTGNPNSPHGTFTATLAAGIIGNATGGVGVSPNAKIYPIVVVYPDGKVKDSYIIDGIVQCIRNHIRIANLTANVLDSNTDFFAQNTHPVLHEYLKLYHDTFGGLFIMSAGNSQALSIKNRLPYLMLVGASDRFGKKTAFSTYGTPLWFMAPGVDIFCTGPDSTTVSKSGTSCSSTIVAGIASLAWGAKPNRTNLQIEQYLIQSCTGGDTALGYGIPNADIAVTYALGQQHRVK